jgi:hypothetical protein
LRRAGDQLRDLDAAAGTDGSSDPGVEHATAERALWKVIRAGRILVAADVLDHDCLAGFADDLHATRRGPRLASGEQGRPGPSSETEPHR